MSSTLRCLRVLELLAEEPFELSIAALSATLKLPKATVHRLCTTLLTAGLIEQNPETRQYALGVKSLWVGSGYLRHSAVYRAAFYPMLDLARQVPGTVQLGVELDGRVVFIHSVGFPGAPHAFADVGLRRDLHATASGKLFLAAMPWADVKRLFEKRWRKYTDRTITSLARMMRELDEVRTVHYARNIEELLPGYGVLAAPVLDREDRIVAAISVTMAVRHMKGEGEKRFAVLIQEACRKTSLHFGRQTTFLTETGKAKQPSRPRTPGASRPESW